MDSLETTACFRDDLFDFPSDISDDDDDDNNHNRRRNAAVVLSSHRHRNNAFSLLSPPSCLRPSAFPEFVEEEELEWISNKDAFPMVESFVDIMPNHPSISTTSNNNNDINNNNSSSHLSPVSVLENSSTSCSINSFNFSSRGTENDNSNNSNSRSRNSSSGSDAGAIAAMIGLTGIFKVPGRARSKQLRRRKREMSGERFYCWEKVKPHSCKVVAKQQQQQQPSTTSSSGIGRKCLHCGSEKTPQWRAGPLGPKTLCNACGVRYKSGRLVPEYRPASSPTFSSELHSNSHRKIVEMRKQKMSIFGDPEERLPHFS